MKIKVIILNFCLYLISLNVSGQVHYFGMQGGMTISNVIDDDFVDNSEYLKGYSAGFSYQFQFSNHFLIGTDLLQVRKGYKSDLIFMDEDGVILKSALSKDYFRYLSLPIKAGYVIGNRFKGYAIIGISTSMLLNAESIVPSYDNQWYETGHYTINYTEYPRKFDLGGIIELGAGYELIEKLQITLITGYNHSLTSFTSPDYFDSQKLKHRSFNISLALGYNLKKR